MTIVVALVLLLVSVRSAYSALAGGLISVISNLYLAGRLFRFDGTTKPSRILRAFYLGELVKILMTVVLFVLAITMLNIEVLFAVLAYVATLPVYWFALLVPIEFPAPGHKKNEIDEY